jgi:RNA polymerase sigma-70 factor, ECF subfamily
MGIIEFNEQLLKLENSLEKFAYGLTLNIADAKDLVQETFHKVIINKDKYIPNTNFKAWAFTIMKSTFINDYRRIARQNAFYDRTTELFLINQSKVSGSDNPVSAYSTLELTQHIEQLNDTMRIPFEMHINGHKYKEIAEELNLNIGTVKSRIFFSRKKLMDQING